jgi:hypothetical protein
MTRVLLLGRGLLALVGLATPAAALLRCQDSVAAGYYGPDDAAVADVVAFEPAASSSPADAAPAPGGESDNHANGPASEHDGSAPGDASKPGKPASPCDLTGRWLVTLRTVTDALGTSQAAHEWYFYDITQTGPQVTVSKGLACGKEVRALTAASGNSDFPKTWPAMMAKLVVTGRKGTSSPASGGCQVSLATTYEVIGATESYYVDPSNALPGASDQASGTTPGWEDWDNDGQPGYTMTITGIASGQIYMVDRTRYALSGNVAASASTFDLAVDWTSEQDVLGVNGPPILSMTASAVKDSNAAMHFATFARLGDSQATGSDSAICSAIRMLAPTMAPTASN